MWMQTAGRSPMYSFKYHLATICAVFLALAIGLLLGAAIAGSGTLNTTTSDLVDSLFERYSSLSTENSEYELESNQYQSLTGEFVESWDDGKLEDRNIMIVTGTSSSESNISDEVAEYVSDAGADYVIVRVSEEAFGTADSEVLASLQEVLPAAGNGDYGETLAQALVAEWTSEARAQEAADQADGESDDGGSDADGDDAADSDSSSSSDGESASDSSTGSSDSSGSGSKGSSNSSGSGSATSSDEEEVSVYDGGAVTSMGQISEDDLAAYPVTSCLIENEIIEIENASAIPDDIDGYVDIYVHEQAASSESTEQGGDDASDGSGSADGDSDSSDAAADSDDADSEDEDGDGTVYYADTIAAQLGNAFDGAEVPVVFTQSSSASSDLMDEASTRGVAGVSSYSGYMGRYSIVTLLASGESGVYGPDRDSSFWYPEYAE